MSHKATGGCPPRPPGHDTERPPAPSKQYDVTPEQRRIIECRAARRQELREQFQCEAFDPLKHGKGGHVFDPAFQRFIAMNASHYEHFRPNLKTGSWGLGLLVLPYLTFLYLIKRNRDNTEASYRRGEVPYKDRRAKFT